MREALLPAINTLPIGSIDTYIESINRIPMLTREQENILAHQWYDEQNRQAAQQLVLSHLRLVVRVARGYLGYGLALSDLIQEGNIGLMKAVKRFNPTLGVRLVTFALHWIKAEIHEFVVRNWRIVKIATTKAQRKLFFRLRALKQQLSFQEKPADTTIIAQTLNVPQATVVEMENRFRQQDANIEEAYDIADHHADPAKKVENEAFREGYQTQLQMAIQTLDERSRHIVEQRWLIENEKDKTPMRKLAEKYGISIERVSQLEKSALSKLRLAFSAE